MSLQHFFLDSQVIAEMGDEDFVLRLSDDDFKHFKVLRMEPGEHFAVIDAVKDYFELELIGYDGGLPLVRIARHLDSPDEGPRVVLVQGLAKGDKMDEIIRHATELGVSGFVPFACERSVVKLDAKKAESRRQRWEAIAKSASMQSGRTSCPEVSLPLGLDELCEFLTEATAVVVFWEEAGPSDSFSAVLRRGMDKLLVAPPDARIALVIGPEGGLSESEVRRILECNPRSGLASLGSSILRTETAGVVASALVLYELGALGPRS